MAEANEYMRPRRTMKTPRQERIYVVINVSQTKMGKYCQRWGTGGLDGALLSGPLHVFYKCKLELGLLG